MTLFRSQVSQCEIYVSKVAFGHFFPNTFVFPCQYRSTSAPLLIFIYTFLLPEGQNEVAWEPSIK